MAFFGSIAGGGICLPVSVGVLMVMLTIMVHSAAVTGQLTTFTIGVTDNTTFSNMTEESTVASTTSVLNCTKNCVNCTGTGENECTECSMNYTLSCKFRESGEPSPDEKCEVGKCSIYVNPEGLTLPLIIGAIAGGVVIIIVGVVVIICCCRRRVPPKPVKRDYRISTVTDDLRYRENGDFPSDEEASIVDNTEMQVTTDDIYGNVDNQGNVIRFNMPNEMEQPSTSNSSKPRQQDFGDIYENNTPSLPAASFPDQRQDFGDVYENTTIGSVSQPVPINRPAPHIPSLPRSSPARRKEEDFGEVYTNEPMQPTRNVLFNNQELLQRINKQASPNTDSHQAPAMPRRPAPQPSRLPELPQKRPTNLPVMQQDNLAFEGDDPHDDVAIPLQKKPAPTVNLSQSVRLSPVALAPPTPGNKFNSLPVQPRETPPSPDDFADQPSRLPPAPPSGKPIKQTTTKPLKSSTPTKSPKLLTPTKALKPVSKTTKKGKDPPPTTKKSHIDRYADDHIKSEVEIGVRPVPSKPDHGDVYEVVESPTPRDFGGDYEVCDIQPHPSPREDFGLSYEYVDQSKQENGGQDYGGSYEVVDTPSTQDYGEDYETVEHPKHDISHRPPMPIPGSATAHSPRQAPPPVMKKKSPAGAARSFPGQHGNSGQGSDDEDWGEDYTNVPNPVSGKRHQPLTHHLQPALPQKLNLLKKGNDFYDDVLQVADDEREDVPGVAYTPGKHYRNVPAKREEPQKQGGYIHFKSKGHY